MVSELLDLRTDHAEHLPVLEGLPASISRFLMAAFKPGAAQRHLMKAFIAVLMAWVMSFFMVLASKREKCEASITPHLGSQFGGTFSCA